MGGIHAGFNAQNQNWVYGIEGDIGAVEDVYDYVASLRGRAGWATDKVLLYGTAGVAFARNDSLNGKVFLGAGNGSDGGDAGLGAGGGGGAGGSSAAFVESQGGNDDEVGFVIGSGMDVKLAERISLGMEGLYYAFDDDRIDVFDTDGDRIARIDSNNDFYVVRARLTYHLQ
jgi:opacity protein-like surface antigen